MSFDQLSSSEDAVTKTSQSQSQMNLFFGKSRSKALLTEKLTPEICVEKRDYDQICREIIDFMENVFWSFETRFDSLLPTHVELCVDEINYILREMRTKMQQITERIRNETGAETDEVSHQTKKSEEIENYSKGKLILPEGRALLTRFQEFFDLFCHLVIHFARDVLLHPRNKDLYGFRLIDLHLIQEKISKLFIHNDGPKGKESISDLENQTMKIGHGIWDIFDQLRQLKENLINWKLNEPGAVTHEMSDQTKRQVNQWETSSQTTRSEIHGLSTQRLLTAEIVKKTTNYARFCFLVTNIAEEVLICSKVKPLKDEYGLTRIQQCRSKLAQMQAKYDQPPISAVDLHDYWQDISDAVTVAGWAKYIEPIRENRLVETGTEAHEVSHEPISDVEDHLIKTNFCKLCIEIFDSLIRQIENRLVETGAEADEVSRQTKRKETEDYSKVFERHPESDDIKMHRVSIELELENRPLLLRALPYISDDNTKTVHLYVYSGDRDTVEEIKKKAEMKYSKFNALIECTDLAITPFKAPPINFPEIVEKLNSKIIEQINNDIQNNLCVFSSHRNVTAIMAGQKVSKSYHTNQPCITVYVMGKGRIPFGETELPKHVGDFATDVVEGFVTELSSRADPELYYTVSRPLKLGVSVGVKGRNSAGTLGAIVKDAEDNMYALSCEHVFNPDPVGENSQIEQPALTDYFQCINYLTKQMQMIAEQEQPEYELNYRMEKLKHVVNLPPQIIGSYKTGVRENVSFNGYTYFVDAALVQLSEEQSRLINKGVELCENKYTPEIYSSDGIKRPEVKVQSTNGSYKPLAKLSKDFELHKCGRTTGLTVKGEMTYEKFYQSVPPEPQNERFSHSDIKNSLRHNCMTIISGDGNLFSDNGDSGSLVLDNDGNAWALIFGKFQNAYGFWRSLACPIEVVLKELGKRIGSELTIISKPRS